MTVMFWILDGLRESVVSVPGPAFTIDHVPDRIEQDALVVYRQKDVHQDIVGVLVEIGGDETPLTITNDKTAGPFTFMSGDSDET